MPTRLATARRLPRRKIDVSPGDSTEVQTLVGGPPWGGYSPDLNHLLGSLNASRNVGGLVPTDGILSQDSGFSLVAPDDLPLGGRAVVITGATQANPVVITSVGHAIPNGTNVVIRDVGGMVEINDRSFVTANAAANTFELAGENGLGHTLYTAGGTASLALAPGTAAQALPIVGLFEVVRQDTPTPPYFLGAAVGQAFPSGTAEAGFLFYWNVVGQAWLVVPHDGLGNPMTADRDDLFDHAFYPHGGTVITAPEVPGLLIFTNLRDQVYKWDIGAGAASTPPGQYGRLFAAFGAHPFFARSVELFDGRLVFIRTKEDVGGALTEQRQRCRWTDIGAATPSLTNPGSGFLDFDEFADEGLRVLRLGDIAACYFRDGVGFLRRTLQTTNPFIRQYITKGRGLLAPFSVCRVANDVHFGVFNDGWFFLNTAGEFAEVGLTSEGRDHRWKEDFYTSLDQENVDLTVVAYDQFKHVVRVSAPIESGGEADEVEMRVWVYDIRTDTVWPTFGYQPICWGETDAVLDSGTTWATATGTWAAATGSWLDASSRFGDRAVFHGTKDGEVRLHDPRIYTRESVAAGPQTFEWRYDSFEVSQGEPFSRATSSQVTVEYDALLVASNLTINACNEIGEQDGDTTNMQDTLNAGSTVFAYSNPHLNGRRLGICLSGNGPVAIHSLSLSFLPEGGDGRSANLPVT